MLVKWLCLTLSLSCCYLSVVCSPEPYCHVNETQVSFRPVVKTRQVVKQPGGVFKKFKKTKSYTETYTDEEEVISWKLVRQCCEGYQMSAMQLCEPVCEKGCPEHARCVEPNYCQCEAQYISATSTVNGTHYCEPMCEPACPDHGHCSAPNKCQCEVGYYAHEKRCMPHCASGCPHGGACVAPEECVCAEGYTAEAGSCRPQCLAGDNCRNGRCVDTEQCVCHAGYLKNAETGVCEHTAEAGTDATEHYSFESTTEESEESVAGEQLSRELDMSEELEELLTDLWDSSTDSSLEKSSPGIARCSADHVYYRGECRAQAFISNDFDCRYHACLEHAYCRQNGSCSCEEGYVWHNPTASVESEQAVEPICLSLAEVNAMSGSMEESPDTSAWWVFLLIGLGAVCILSAAILLGLKWARRHSGSVEVKARNELCCKYENESFSEKIEVY